MQHLLSAKQKISKEFAYAVIAMLLPLLVQLCWLMHNTQLPIADATEQLVTSYQIYQDLVKHEWLRFICQLYDRYYQWRPTGFYIFQVPFQIISGGNLMFTIRGVTLLGTGVSCLYIYYILRLMLTPVLAILGTIIMGLLPCVQWPGTCLGYSEIAFLPAILATLYYFIRSDNLQNKKYRTYFIIAVAADFAIRPVEAVNHLALLFVIFLALSWRRKAITTQELYRIILGALIGASVLVATVWLQNKVPLFSDTGQDKFFRKTSDIVFLSTLAFLAIPVGKYVYHWYRTTSFRFSNTECTFIAIYTLIVLFYITTMDKMVEWTYVSNFGVLAQMKIPKARIILANFIMNTGVIPFVCITTLGTMSFVFCLTKEQKNLLRDLVLYAFSIIPITLIITFFTVQFTQRKVTVIMSIFLLIMLIPAMMRGRLWYARNIVLALIAAVQIHATLSIANNETQDKFGRLIAGSTAGGGNYPTMITASPNPNDALFNFLQPVAKRNHYKFVLFPIIEFQDITIDPFLIAMFPKITGDDISVIFPPYMQPYDLYTVLVGSDALLLITDREGKFIQSPEEAQRLKLLADSPHSDLTQKLRFTLNELYAEDKLKDLGINKKDCIYLDSIKLEACIFGIDHTKQK